MPIRMRPRRTACTVFLLPQQAVPGQLGSEASGSDDGPRPGRGPPRPAWDSPSEVGPLGGGWGLRVEPARWGGAPAHSRPRPGHVRRRSVAPRRTAAPAPCSCTGVHGETCAQRAACFCGPGPGGLLGTGNARPPLPGQACGRPLPASVAWEPTGDGRRVISLADSHVLLWDLQESSSQAVLASSASLEGKGQLKFTSGRWSPHHTCTQVATANDTTIRGWDTRSMSQTYCIENAHGQLVRDLDFNPNKQYYLASCGDDCKVKFWDTRNVTEPVKSLEEHSHWVWNVRYNHSHDQLVLTGSSDSRVILSNMVSISSEPFGHLVDDEDLSDQEECRPEKSQEPPQDSVIATYDEHEDSVYAVDWSSADPWLFASLSYDGRLVINRVPRALKYHILL
ncbi:EARP and GARP complex-interacting protein 1-like [Suricata suricatta]|uniref:EARP and GARP complex-interacting protein 1-like n=1 Tax=Suricata suricatta TaxID=37032 RepID=UPI001155A0C2|nr:EARP and GARP complex-interacting protein 1-like [Suricata suricatta]